MIFGESVSDESVKSNPRNLKATEKSGNLGEERTSGFSKDLADIYSVLDTDTVETTLQSFRDNEVHSVPVYSSADKSKFLGLVDTADIMEYFFSLKREDLDTRFFQTPVGELIEISKFNPTPMVSIGTSLIEVLQTLEKGETHRVGVLDPSSGALYNIISQMSLLRFISRNISLMDGELRDKLVSTFMKKIVTVENIPSDTNTFSAFEYLFKRNISAAAVVDVDGNLVDTLSTTDIVGFLYDRFSNIDNSVMKFLSSTRRTKSFKPPIVCTLIDTFEYVIMKLTSTHVHRLWVVEDNRYLGLVNLTNVLHAVAHFVETEN